MMYMNKKDEYVINIDSLRLSDGQNDSKQIELENEYIATQIMYCSVQTFVGMCCDRYMTPTINIEKVSQYEPIIRKGIDDLKLKCVDAIVDESNRFYESLEINPALFQLSESFQSFIKSDVMSDINDMIKMILELHEPTLHKIYNGNAAKIIKSIIKMILREINRNNKYCSGHRKFDDYINFNKNLMEYHNNADVMGLVDKSPEYLNLDLPQIISICLNGMMENIQYQKDMILDQYGVKDVLVTKESLIDDEGNPFIRLYMIGKGICIPGVNLSSDDAYKNVTLNSFDRIFNKGIATKLTIDSNRVLSIDVNINGCGDEKSIRNRIYLIIKEIAPSTKDAYYFITDF